MKHILLNTDVSTDDYGHYITYSEVTGEVGYVFKYKNLPVKDLPHVFKEVRAVVGTDSGVCIYGKSGSAKYGTPGWDLVSGTLPTDTTDALVQEGYTWFKEVETIETPDGLKISAPGFWLTLSTMYAHHGDLGGWGKDLIAYASDLSSNPNLGFPGGSFTKEAWAADLDAYNIYTLHGGSQGLEGALREYYTGTLTEEKRVKEFISRGDNMLTRYNSSGDMSYLTELAGTLTGVTEETIRGAINNIQEYIDRYRG